MKLYFGKNKRRRSLQALPKRFSAKSTYIFPSRHGLLFVVVLLGMLVGSVNYNNNLGFLLAFLLGSMAFVSIFHTSRNLDGVEIVSCDAEPVYAGEKAVFKFKVIAPDVERPGVSWTMAGGDPLTVNLSSKTENPVRFDRPAQKRGWVRPDLLTVQTHYPLGLFRSWLHFRPDVRCLVYPKPLPVEWKTAATSEGGEEDDKSESVHAGAVDFQGLRTYRPGDSLKHISWKAYSKGQGLYTKMFGQPEAVGGVCLDWDELPDAGTEKKLSMLCHMVLKAHSLGMEYALNLPGKTVETSKGENHKHNCLKALALFGRGDD